MPATSIVNEPGNVVVLPGDTCPAVEQPGCNAAGMSSLSIKQDTSGNTKMQWQWSRGAAIDPLDFGDPLAKARYALCLYDQGVLIRSEDLGWSCLKGKCWKVKGLTGWGYKDKSLDGAASLTLAGGDARKSKLKVKSTSSLTPVTLPLSAPVTVQLRTTDSPSCWTATFDTADILANGPAFKAKFTP